jgi:hypothetical protein
MLPCGVASMTEAVSIRRFSAAEPGVYMKIDLETLGRAMFEIIEGRGPRPGSAAT